jgi:hypothetical protein
MIAYLIMEYILRLQYDIDIPHNGIYIEATAAAFDLSHDIGMVIS